jgi:D-xylose 1-dehydrogenase
MNSANGYWSTTPLRSTASDHERPDNERHEMTDPTASASADYASYPSLVDRTILVTGGADGIGATLVEQFTAQGSKVAFVDLNVTRAAETIARCREREPRHTPRFYEVDLVDIDALRAAVSQAQQDLGGVTVLVNNAANDERHRWQDMTVEYWNDRLNTNLRHYFFAIQAVAPGMIAAQNGSIINIGSSSYLMQEDFFPGYAIAKSGVEGITRTFARTFGPDNVRVNTVMPGWVATERQLTKWWSPEGEAATLRDQALKRRISPSEFAQMVLFLAADDGAACTAQQFLVDGGRF